MSTHNICFYGEIRKNVYLISSLIWSYGFIFLPKNVVIFINLMGWSGGVKVSCILSHWGIQLILAYSWARPAIFVAGLFLHFHSSSSFLSPSIISSTLLYLFSPFFWEMTQNDPLCTMVDVKPQHNQSVPTSFSHMHNSNMYQTFVLFRHNSNESSYNICLV